MIGERGLAVATCPASLPEVSAQCIDPLLLISTAGSALIVLRSSVCWIWQQLGKGSVVEPTWLPNSNPGASLCRNERLKDQAEIKRVVKRRRKRTIFE